MKNDFTSTDLDLIAASLNFAHYNKELFQNFYRQQGHPETAANAERLDNLRQDINQLYTQALDEDYLKLSIDYLSFSVRTTRLLENIGISTIKELVSKTRDDLDDLCDDHSFGEMALGEIREKLKSVGLALKGT